MRDIFKEGAICYLLINLEIREVVLHYDWKGIILKVKSRDNRMDYGIAERLYYDGKLFISKIVVYTILEEKLLDLLGSTRQVIRQHRQKFNRTDNLNEFKSLNTDVSLEDIEREIMTQDYNQIYHEDKLTDTE